MLEILKQYFGYEAFRPLQQEIIERVVSGKDTVALMPTGGGKSLCYQLPALMFDGITLVVSPLIALMKDQVDGLTASGIEAAFLNSSLTARDAGEVVRRAREGHLKILYIAPERIRSSGFSELLSTLPVSLIAIDEAHCISEWGHDFRPEYRSLTLLRTLLPAVPIIALTATATEQVRDDIVWQLSLREPQIFIASFNRPNLYYHALPKDRFKEQLRTLLTKYKNESIIFYCFSRTGTEKLAARIEALGFKAAAYHAGLDSTTRGRIQDRFIKDDVRIITATVAFGMGIDKPDVRLVVHCDLPKSLEGYYQETGRAGRDGLASECVLFYSAGDLHKQTMFINQLTSEVERENAFKKLAQMLGYAESTVCRRKQLLNYFGERFEAESCKNCDSCLGTHQLFDATVAAQKILSAVVRTGMRFGASYISLVLLGEEDERVVQRGHDKLSVFGIMKAYTKRQILTLIRQLVTHGLLMMSGEEYPILTLTARGKQFLEQKETLELPQLVETTTRQERKQRQTVTDYDQGLFEQLRQLRKQLAEERGVPPYIIFGDTTLREMANRLPQTSDDLMRITGVGARKLEAFGELFLNVIVPYTAAHGLTARSNPPATRSRKATVNKLGVTLELLQQKVSLEEIAERRGVLVGTVIADLEKMIEANPELDIQYLVPKPDRLKKISDAFAASEDWRLTPVKEILGDNYSFDEIKLARIFIRTRSL